MARTKSLSKQIREAREGKGVTVAQLAVRLGVSQGTIYHWESGRARPTDMNLAALTKALMPVGEIRETVGSLGAGLSTERTHDVRTDKRTGEGHVAIHAERSVSVAQMDALLERLADGIAGFDEPRRMGQPVAHFAGAGEETRPCLR